MTFKDRLKGALIMAGYEPAPEHLSRICLISMTEAKAWLNMVDSAVPANLLAPLAKRSRARLFWIVTGEGQPQSHFALNGKEREGLKILHSLSGDNLEKWLRTGRHLIST